MKRKRLLGDWVSDLALASFFPTIFLLSVPLELYLGNPGEFPDDVLHPYWLAFCAIMGVLWLLSIALSPTWRCRLSRLFFFIGMFLYLSQILVPVRMSSLIGMENQPKVLEPFSAILLQLLILALLVCGFIWLPQKLLRTMGGAMAICILALLLVKFAAAKCHSDNPIPASSEKIAYPAPQAPKSDGNIYRLLFDGFSSQEFAAAFPTSKHQGALKDFLFYNENRSNYLWTLPSVVCCKTGSFFKGGNMRKWISKTSTPTITKRLMKAGWIVSSYGNPMPWISEPVHRNVSFADANRIQQNSQDRILHDLHFADLCLLRLVPVPWRKNVYDRGMGLLSRHYGRKGAFRSDHLRIGTALNVFRTLLAEEKLRGPKGHYVEAHINIPHVPWVLDGELVYHPERTTYYDQIQACLNLVSQFVSELKRLGHYDNATIMIHSDHGLSSRKNDLPIVATYMTGEIMSRIDAMIKRPGFNSKKMEQFSRSLMLIKPAHRSAPRLIISPRETQTADIAATIFSLAGLSIANENGQSILSDSFPVQREIHIFEGFVQPGGKLAIRIPRCEMNHFSFTKGIGWKIYTAIPVVND